MSYQKPDIQKRDESSVDEPEIKKGNITFGKKQKLLGTIQSSNKKKTDMDFAFDTTGSMDGEIEACRNLGVDFSNDLTKEGLDLAFNLVSFGDLDEPGTTDLVKVELDPGSDVESFQKMLWNMKRNNGYGNGGESCLEAIDMVVKLSHRQNTVKTLTVITDDAAHQTRHKVGDIINLLVEKEYLVFVISPDISYYREMAKRTHGFWQDISEYDNGRYGYSSTKARSSAAANQTLQKVIAQIKERVKAVYSLTGGSVSQFYLKDPNADK